MTTAGNTAMYCAHCGRPCAVATWIGSLPFHPECTRGPGYQEQRFEPLPTRHYTAPMDDERVRQIVRDELIRTGVLVKPVCD